MDLVHVRCQLRSTGILQAIRLYREGFPDSLNFADFRRQFEVLRVSAYEGKEDNDTLFDEREVTSLHNVYLEFRGRPTTD